MKNITYIAGVARSGTSWLGQIFDSAVNVNFRFQPLFSYEFKNKVNEDSSALEFEQLLVEMHDTATPFLTQEDKRSSGQYPNFPKNKVRDHLVFKENRYQNIIEPMMRKVPTMKLVAIIRNPNAALSSWMKNQKEFPAGSTPKDEWRYGDCKNQGHEDFFGYYKWKEVANMYLDLADKWPDRVYLIKYEDLVNAPLLMTEEMFSFCDISMDKQTSDFLSLSTKSHDNSPYSVFKSKQVIDNWKSDFDPYITQEIFQDLQGTRLEKFIK
ncbi:MAG: hypothetical protein ACI89T_000457 [Cognaticolwellia sp.]|jgi:hypothetical protein